MLGTLVPRVERLPRPFGRIEREFENLFERMMGNEEARWPVWAGFSPTFNLAETEARFEVTMELPGMKPEEFNVELKNGELWITGEKKEERQEKGKTFHRVARTHGEFRRVIPLPGTVNEEKINAEYKAGVLKVFVPKTEAARSRHIEVKA
jgi:HSP20 family protein